ncbi:MAG: VPLPA-CTERM sorting domain-containing protein [Methylococcales bacterium]
MKIFLKITAVCFLLVSISVNASNTVDWTNWTTNNPTTETGTLTQSSTSITVTYTGNHFDVDHSNYFYNVPASFTSPTVTNTPDTNGTIRMTGGDKDINTIHFSSPVTNPVMAFVSLGQLSYPVSFDFLNNPVFSVLSYGPGNWGGPGTITQSGSSITGVEGNGTIGFAGVFTDISFTTPVNEYYYGFTVGATVSAVPVPAAVWFMGSALLGLVGFKRRRA